MEPPVTLSATPLARLFSDEYRFTVPWYQRAYAWRDDHAERLLDDVREAGALDQWYHLGTIILAKDATDKDVTIVDGQQRITTLTILFSVLRDLIGDSKQANALDERIWSSSGSKKARQARLSPKDTIGDVLHDYVQAGQATSLEPDIALADEFNASQCKVVDNRDTLRKILETVPRDELLTIADHLQNKCYVVVEKFDDDDTASRVFTNSQERGLRLVATDLFKVSVLNHVPAASRDRCAEVWDKWADRLGNEALAALLKHMRDIKIRKKKRQKKEVKAPIEKELLECYEIDKHAEAFVMEEFAPMADLFRQVDKFWLAKGTADG